MQKFKSIFRRVLIFAFFLVILLANTQSQAVSIGITEYSSRSAFEDAVPSALVQGWDSEIYTDGYIISNGSADDKGITYFCSAGNAIVDTDEFRVTTLPGSLGNKVEGYWYETTTGYFYSTDTIKFVFPTPIRAFGIDVNTTSPTDAAYQATTNLGDIAYSHVDHFPDYDTGQFIGFASSVAFSEVTIGLGPGAVSYSYTLDTLRYQPVPLPGSLLLLGSGLLGLVGWRRIRKG